MRICAREFNCAGKGTFLWCFPAGFNFIFTPDFALWAGKLNLYCTKDPLSRWVPRRVGDRRRTLPDGHLGQLPGYTGCISSGRELATRYLVESGTTYPFASLPLSVLLSLPLFFLFLAFYFHQRYLLHTGHSA